MYTWYAVFKFRASIAAVKNVDWHNRQHLSGSRGVNHRNIIQLLDNISSMQRSYFAIIKRQPATPSGGLVVTLEYYYWRLPFSSIPTVMRFSFFFKHGKRKRDQMLKAPSSMGRYSSTRVNEAS